MPYQFTAQNITHCNPLTFVREGDVVVGLICRIDVNYGTLGLTHEVDVWNDLTDEQKQRAQQVYNFLKAKVEQIVLE